MESERITREILDCCLNPTDTLDALGTRLASYLLRPDAREKAGLPPPELPDGRGSLVALVVLNRPGKGPDPWPALGRGVGIPLCWKEGTPDSSCLPGGLVDVATEVRRVTRYEGWGLDFAEQLEGYDLSALAFDVPSLWAPLAAGLALAVHGGKPDTSVFSTGRWTAGGLVGVGCIQAKMEAALDLAGGKKPTFYVAAANHDEALEKFGGRVAVVSYQAGESDWLNVLAGHLARLDVPPQRLPGNLPERIDYAKRPYIVRNREKRRNYYLENLVDDLANNLADKTAGILPEGGLDGLILSLSKSYELCMLLLRALRPQRALVVYTEDTKKYLDKTGDGVKPQEYEYEKEKEAVCLEECTKWLRETSAPGRCAVEVTGGTKPMTLVLAEAARDAGARILYLDHDFENNSPVAGTERIRVLDWFER